MLPTSITQGDTVTFSIDATITVGDSFRLLFKNSGFTTNGVPNVSTVNFSLYGDDSKRLKIGSETVIFYKINSKVRTILSTGTITILEDPLFVPGETHARRMLRIIDAALEHRATDEMMSQSIDGMSLSYLSPTQLFELKQKYEYLVACEDGNPPLPTTATLSWRR